MVTQSIYKYGGQKHQIMPSIETGDGTLAMNFKIANNSLRYEVDEEMKLTITATNNDYLSEKLREELTNYVSNEHDYLLFFDLPYAQRVLLGLSRLARNSSYTSVLFDHNKGVMFVLNSCSLSSKAIIYERIVP